MSYSTAPTVTIDRALLEEIADGFRQEILNQHKLVEIAIGMCGGAAEEAMLISIGKFNRDLHGLNMRIDDLLEAEAQS